MAMRMSGGHIKRSDINEYIYTENNEISGKVVSYYHSDFVLWILQTFQTGNTQQCFGDPDIPSDDTFYRAGCKVYCVADDLLSYTKFGYIKTLGHLTSAVVRFGYDARSTAFEAVHAGDSKCECLL